MSRDWFISRPDLPQCNGVLRVLGGAPCLFEDMENAPEGDNMALNLAGVHFRHIAHWASVNGHEFHKLIEARENKGWPLDMEIHCRGEVRDTSAHVHHWPSRIAGSSSMFGTLVGLSLGYEPVILCGCPLQGTNALRGSGGGYENFLPVWREMADQLKGRVFSMSGLTRDLLGEPA